MNEPEGATSWKAVLLVVGGIVLALFLAALLSQMDLLQKRRILPAERLQIIDLEATISAGEVTLVNLSGDVGVELATPPAAETEAVAVTRAGTAVPVFAPTCAAAPAGWSLYTAQEGDSLSSLAAQFDVTVEALRLANCLNGTQGIAVGQRVFVMQDQPTATPEEITDCSIPTGWATHTVTLGETLASLAVERNTTISLILRVNCLVDEDVTAGNNIYLPSLTPATTAATAAALPLATLPLVTRTIATATRALVPATMTQPLPTPTRAATMTATAAPNPAAVATRTPSAAPSLPLPATATTMVTATTTSTTRPTAAATWTPTTTPSPSATATLAPRRDGNAFGYRFSNPHSDTQPTGNRHACARLSPGEHGDSTAQRYSQPHINGHADRHPNSHTNARTLPGVAGKAHERRLSVWPGTAAGLEFN